LAVASRTKGAPASEIDYGPVLVTRGRHAGRIGEFDDDSGRSAIVYFGHPFVAPGYHLIPARYLAPVTTASLMKRRGELFKVVGPGGAVRHLSDDAGLRQRLEFVTELALIEDQLADRYLVARLSGSKKGRRIFISHSSKDHDFAISLAVDLGNLGHRLWLDQWEIRAGESIPTRLAEGIERCEFVTVVLTDHAVESKWVEREWQAKYWDEVSAGRIHVIPALLRTCTIPTLLRMKKYADFTGDYDLGLEELRFAINPVRKRR